jgi:hypothetical protein
MGKGGVGGGTDTDIETRYRRIVEEAPDRRRAAFVAEARGEQPSETVEQVDLERRQAEVEIAGGRERVAALRVVEQEIAEQVEAVEDAHPEHFIAKAVSRSEAVDAKLASLAQEAAAAVAEWREAQREWSGVRKSCLRRGVRVPGEVLVSDLGAAISELGKAQGGPYPGGRRAAWERYCEEAAAEKAPRRPVRKALTRFEAA